MVKVIVNAIVITPDRLIHEGTVWIDEGRTVACGPQEQLPPPDSSTVIDAKGLYVAPGFVDVHCHGGGGYWAYRNPAEFARFHLNFGTTSILPTFSYNETEEQVMEGLRLVMQAQDGPYGRAIAGIHMEGPYINPKYGAIGIGLEAGSIEIGKRANLIVMTEDIQVQQVYLDGQSIELQRLGEGF